MSTFTVVLPNDAVEFNEVYRNFTGTAGYFVANNIYSRLVLHGTKSPAVFPDLARHWEILDGGARYRFYLDPQARWHDGEPVTAHDVAYSHSYAIEQGYHAATFLTGVVAIDEIDEHTVEYRLDAPNAGFLTQLGNFAFTHILPAHLYEGTDWATNPANLNPVGSGPFRFGEWVPGEKITMRKNEDYFGQPAFVDEVELRVVPDRVECLRMVSAGEADYMVEEILTPARIPDWPETEAAVFHHEPSPSISALGFNFAQERFGDERLRRAIAHAIDRSAFDGLAGVGRGIRNFLPPILEWAFAADAEVVGEDLAESARLLDELGYAPGPDGVRMNLRLRFLDLFDGFSGLADIVVASLARVGIAVEWKSLDPVSYAQQISKDGEFDLLVMGGNMMPDPEIIASRFESTGRRNIQRYASAAADAAFRDGRATIDRAERAAAYRRLQEVWASETAHVPLYWGSLYMLRSRAHFGWSDQLDSRVPYWHWGRIREIG